MLINAPEIIAIKTPVIKNHPLIVLASDIFLSEKFDVNKDEAYKNIKVRIEKDSLDYLKKEMSKYNTIIVKENTNDLIINNTKYILLPVYVLNIKYKDKIYHFAMNGESSKLVGEIPIDKKKLVIYMMLTFGVSLFMLLGIFLLLGYRW